MSRLSIEKNVEFIIDILKRKQNRPCFIKRKNNVRCHLCKKRHDGFLIKDFDSKNNMFTIVHCNQGEQSKPKKQTPLELHTFLIQCIQRGHVKLTDLLKKIDITEFKKTYIINLRLTDDEDILLKKAAKNARITVSQYARSKLLDYQ